MLLQSISFFVNNFSSQIFLAFGVLESISQHTLMLKAPKPSSSGPRTYYVSKILELSQSALSFTLKLLDISHSE